MQRQFNYSYIFVLFFTLNISCFAYGDDSISQQETRSYIEKYLQSHYTEKIVVSRGKTGIKKRVLKKYKWEDPEWSSLVFLDQKNTTIEKRERFIAEAQKYFLSPEYICTEPAKAMYFDRFFAQNKLDFASDDCQIDYDIEFEFKQRKWKKSIEPSRIYQIHYLLADKGETMASRFGHSMFRLVICSPERKRVSEKCMRDTKHHLVISFAGVVNDFIVNQAAGVFGKYDAKIHFLTLDQTLLQYQRSELRSLSSYPLELDREQIREFVYRTLNYKNNYRGKYKYFSNNCAQLSFELVRYLEKDRRVNPLILLSPRQLLARLIKEGFIVQAEMTVEERKKTGHYFESYGKEMRKWLRALNISWSVEEFIALPAEQRKEVYLAELEDNIDKYAVILLLEKVGIYIKDRALKNKVDKLITENLSAHKKLDKDSYYKLFNSYANTRLLKEKQELLSSQALMQFVSNYSRQKS